MAKFLKSFFQTEKRSHSYEGSSEDDRMDLPSTMEGRRKLSVSRSGRMKQAQKKRLSLSLDIYGNDTLQMPEKPKKMEYHVNPITSTANFTNQRRRSGDSKTSSESDKSIKSEEKNDPKTTEIVQDAKQRKMDIVEKVKTPEEEIDTAFQIIDNTLS
ncbi:unnamed protein product [Diatraea saccharalis]|uniref:Uncharacterized protein n=1 Tax=Diatraea saccharalis TaxID=40085 RepID=A0A9N9RDY3_9NEOP|nr:unnamed protein product [Diatraea saccharalis]